MSTPTPPGWYPDPDDPASLRFFDGRSWTTGRAPAFPDEIQHAPPSTAASGASAAAGTSGGIVPDPASETPAPDTAGGTTTHVADQTPPPGPDNTAGSTGETLVPGPGSTGDTTETTGALPGSTTPGATEPMPAPGPGSTGGAGAAFSTGFPSPGPAGASGAAGPDTALPHAGPPATGGFPSPGGYPPPSAGFPPPSGGYPPPSAGFPPPSGDYPPPSAGFPPPSGGYPPPAGSHPPPGGGYPPPGSSTNGRVRLGPGRRRLLIGGGVALVLFIAVGSFLVLRGDEPRFEWQGEEISEPEVILEDAEATVDTLVDERNGALSDDSRCYFSLPEDEGIKDVNDWVRCGPVLFVDGDVEEPYLSFPLTAADDDGDLRLEVGERPVDPEPTALDPDERLERPDDLQPPEGAGGLEPPEPPPAPEDLLGVVDLGPTSTGTPPAGAVIGSLSASYELTVLASIDRYGLGDTARRPADGHQLIAFEVSKGLGEIVLGNGNPTVEVQIDEGTPRDVTDLIDGDNPVVVSAPEDAGSVDLVVTDGDVVQRLSLLDGAPDAGNLQVLTRTNRSQTIGQTHEVSVTGTDAIGSLPLAGTVDVAEVHLGWALQEDPTKRASSGETALLIVVLNYNWPNVTPSDGGLAEQAFTLALPDGRAIPAVNLAPDPANEVIIAFEVPADFTEGTLNIGGVSSQPGGLTIDFGGNVYQTAISIPAG